MPSQRRLCDWGLCAGLGQDAAGGAEGQPTLGLRSQSCWGCQGPLRSVPAWALQTPRCLPRFTSVHTAVGPRDNKCVTFTVFRGVWGPVGASQNIGDPASLVPGLSGGGAEALTDEGRLKARGRVPPREHHPSSFCGLLEGWGYVLLTYLLLFACFVFNFI